MAGTLASLGFFWQNFLQPRFHISLKKWPPRAVNVSAAAEKSWSGGERDCTNGEKSAAVDLAAG